MPQAHFTLINPLMTGRFSHSGYIDKATGEEVYIPGRNSKGEEVAQFFTWNTRTFTATSDRVINFLRNSPFCEGSPNLPEGEDPYYKELNPERDAEEFNAFEDQKIEALTMISGLTPDQLRQVAVLAGASSTVSSIQKRTLFDIANKDPKKVIDLVKSLNIDGESRALVKSAVDRETIKLKNGFMYMWNEVHLGNDENEAVKKLMNDSELKSALQKAYDSQKPQPTVNKVNGSNAKSKGR